MLTVSPLLRIGSRSRCRREDDGNGCRHAFRSGGCAPRRGDALIDQWVSGFGGTPRVQDIPECALEPTLLIAQGPTHGQQSPAEGSASCRRLLDPLGRIPLLLTK